MPCNVLDRHKTKGGETVSEFEIFIAYVVAEIKERPEEPAKPERMGNYDTEYCYNPQKE